MYGQWIYHQGPGCRRKIFEYLLSSPALSTIPVIILDVDYTHAPEYPFPAALDDIHVVVSQEFDNPITYASSKIIIGGSAQVVILTLGISTLLGGKAS